MTLISTKTAINTLIYPLKTVVAIFVLLALSSVSYSQTNTQEQTNSQWYQVELFVFANTNPAAAGTERWPVDLGLKYPEKMLSLKKNQQLPDDTPTTKSYNTHNTPTITKPTTHDNADQQNAQTLQTLTLLNPKQHQLTQPVKKILAKPNFRLLFHGAWRQIIGNRTESESLLIRGGDAYDQHFELEGYVTLSVERYLHINTDLWFSTFVSNLGNEHQYWQVLPYPPEHIATPELSQNVELFSSSTPQKQLSFTDTSDTSLQTSLQQSLQNSFTRLHSNSPFQNTHNNHYSVEQTVVMRQHRRMRSNELHYIDHPMMGLLIKITPYELPTETQSATEPE